ncbi:MAG: DUF5668 domain-containing protein [Pseudomonadota bacterium]
MSNKHFRTLPAQVVVGVLAIGMGALFLLDSLGLIDFHGVLHFWPMVFIVFGALKIADTRTAHGLLVGAVLIGVGVLMTLHSMGLIRFGLHTMWPLLLIAAGVAIVLKAVGARAAPSTAGGEAGEDVVDVTAILGGFQRRITSARFRGGEVTAIMGGCELDLRQAGLDGEAQIKIFALCGGVAIKVPTDWTVVMHGTPILGGFEEKTATPPDASKRLIVRGYAIMGGVEVRN